jgi:hypothetical protein
MPLSMRFSSGATALLVINKPTCCFLCGRADDQQMKRRTAA